MRLTTFTTIAILAANTGLADDIRTETVQFPAGASGTSISDTIKGYESVSYILGAGEGQTMTVNMEVDNLSAYFNVYVPGKGPGDEAMFIGSTAGNHFEAELPASGDYTVSVYLYRNAARREDTANYTVDFSIK